MAVFVLIHSPFVGALTWRPTARALRQKGHSGIAPTLDRTNPPFWPQYANVIAEAVQTLRTNEPLVLVAHSAAGLGVHTPEEYRQWLRQRDSHPADLIRREVLARHRRALVIYGDGHLQARSECPGRSLVGILETGGARTFAITTTFADLAKFQP